MTSDDVQFCPTPEHHHVSDVFIDKLCCVICTYLLDRPLDTSYGVVVCLDCCCKWIQVTLQFPLPFNPHLSNCSAG